MDGHRIRLSWKTLKARATPIVWVGTAICVLVGQPATRADEPRESAAAKVYLLESASGLMAASGTGKFQGARSCAATACHGGIEPDPRFPLSQRNEYSSWLDHDPHARAHRTLSNEKSRIILQRLARANETAEDRDRRLANCFACHNPQPAQDRQAATYYSREGVSCEICHGASEQWIGAHVVADWGVQKKTDRQAWRARTRELGYVDTEDLTIRGKTCAQCHVGSPDREVNHDLIAAGHPVLKFELAAYHELLPKHWRANRERERVAQFETALWSAGQIAAADAALSLLEWRAKPSTTKHPDAAWPELAEYDCFACHHDLEDPSWRRQRTVAGQQLGTSEWGSWYFGPLRQMNDATGEVAQKLTTLTEQMREGFGNDRQKVQQAVAAARTQLDRWSSHESVDVAATMRRALDKLVLDHEQPQTSIRAQPAGWDEAVQLFLAIVAMDRANGAIESNAIDATRELFSFPATYDSPYGFFGQRPPGTLLGGPPTTKQHQKSRQQIVAALVELIQQLKHTGN
jgi:hypothetical protein